MSEPPKYGRPKKGDGPRFPRDEVDRILVEGEEVTGEDGRLERRWPSVRDLARRYGVAPSLIARFAKTSDCAARRKAFVSSSVGPRTKAKRVPDRAPTELREPPRTAPTSKLRLVKGEGASVLSPRGSVRPRGLDAPAFPIEELDRLLVFGEVVQFPDGTKSVVYPSMRDLANRFGVSLAYIGTYAKHHNCARRREEAKARIAAKVDQKLVELRADAIAVSKDDAIRMIDNFLTNFERALAEGRVRFDNPNDFNTMLRLKEFVMGGADSRQEVHAMMSLESIQERHAKLMKVVQSATPAEKGVIDARALRAREALDDADAEAPVTSSDEPSSDEPNVADSESDEPESE